MFVFDDEDDDGGGGGGIPNKQQKIQLHPPRDN
jgi:hypothetical protein